MHLPTACHRMHAAQGVESDGSLRAAKQFDTFIADEHAVHAGPKHMGFRVALFMHFVPEDRLHAIQPFTQVTAATTIHHFSDFADNLLGDRAMLQWASDKPWLSYIGLPMWETLVKTLPALQKEYYNDKTNSEGLYVDPDLLRDLHP